MIGGNVRHGMAWLPTPWETARRAPTTNLLSSSQQEHFQQAIGALRLTHRLENASAFQLALQQNILDGAYDLPNDSERETLNLRLAHNWTQGSVTWRSAGAQSSGGERSRGVEAGLLASTFARTHQLRLRRDRETPLYSNVGTRREMTSWSRITQPLPSRMDVSGELQIRHSLFAYTPSQEARLDGVSFATRHWTFVNPRVRLGWDATSSLRADVTASRVTREPTRGDLFGGADDLDRMQADLLAQRGDVTPEQLHTVELRVTGGAVGTTARSPTTIALGAEREPSWSIAMYASSLRNEIAAAGPLSATGLPLRRNVPRGERRGIEVVKTHRIASNTGVRVSGSAMRARLVEWVDEGSGDTVRNVRPILAPSVQMSAQIEQRIGRQTLARLELQGQNESFVSPLNRASDRLPALLWGDVVLQHRIKSLTASLRINNITDAFLPLTGWADAERPAVFPLAGRHVMISASVPLR